MEFSRPHFLRAQILKMMTTQPIIPEADLTPQMKNEEGSGHQLARRYDIPQVATSGYDPLFFIGDLRLVLASPLSTSVPIVVGLLLSMVAKTVFQVHFYRSFVLGGIKNLSNDSLR
ncbi:hypothetical protein BDW59DRAFT_151038 [Aspergillus cavernicola]|uniref:Uncharacterized protein n=1 Tax=Aspergillus cavernicola TaxID=176166 RepID=A0ABR4HWN2_9EURO